MKTFIKKFVSVGTAALCIVPLSFSMTACGGGEEGGEEGGTTYYTVSFESNGGSSVSSQSVEAGSTAAKPADPTRDGYDFTAWYSDSTLTSEYNFSTAVNSDLTLYAGWDEQITLYTITFDYNYSGSTADTVSVVSGGTVERPADPEREGYTFMGWYTDADGTGDVYDFSAAVTGDATIYAVWYELPSGYCLATFYLNDGTGDFYTRVAFQSRAYYQNIVADVDDPAWENHYFTGWYKDADATAQYNSLDSFTENIDVYADWQNIYTLEAEHTNLTAKQGYGYSGSTSGTGMIETDNTDNGSASNGYYVTWMYYKGEYLTFEIESDRDVDDVTIIFRLSARYCDIDVTGDQIYVGINYDDATETYETTYDFPMTISSYEEMSNTVKDFQNYTVAYNVSLHQGSNTIEIVINNSINGPGGTMNAAAPLIDCMYLYTDAVITQTIYNSEYTK